MHETPALSEVLAVLLLGEENSRQNRTSRAMAAQWDNESGDQENGAPDEYTGATGISSSRCVAHLNSRTPWHNEHLEPTTQSVLPPFLSSDVPLSQTSGKGKGNPRPRSTVSELR